MALTAITARFQEEGNSGQGFNRVWEFGRSFFPCIPAASPRGACDPDSACDPDVAGGCDVAGGVGGGCCRAAPGPQMLLGPEEGGEARRLSLPAGAPEIQREN